MLDPIPMKPIRWWQCWPPRIMWFSILLTMPSGTLAGSAIDIDLCVHYYAICFMSTITLNTVIIIIMILIIIIIILFIYIYEKCLFIYLLTWYRTILNKLSVFSHNLKMQLCTLPVYLNKYIHNYIYSYLFNYTFNLILIFIYLHNYIYSYSFNYTFSLIYAYLFINRYLPCMCVM